MYFGKDGDALVTLLGGGTKKRQDRDVAIARERAMGRVESVRRGRSEMASDAGVQRNGAVAPSSGSEISEGASEGRRPIPSCRGFRLPERRSCATTSTRRFGSRN